MCYSFHFRDYDYPPDIDLTEVEPEPEPEQKISLENETGKLLEFLVIGLSSKTLSQQAALVSDRVNHISNSISKSSDTFGERLANESEEHLLKIIKSMEDDISVVAMLWKLRKLKHVIGRFEEILQDEQRLRRGKDNFEYI
jgi:hypothetical protein